MCFVTVPHPLGMISKEEVNAKVDAAFDDIVKAATAWTPAKEKQDAQVKPYPAKRFKFSGTYADVNDMFQKRKWSLSLPIVPPTVDKVAAMLKGTKRDPAEVLWVVPPRQGMLTVELVAALGVMAGAKPEHMPLLIATVEAMAEPDAAWRGPTTTTAATVPVFFISGPIIEKLKLNPGTGTAGGENPVTNALGYFVNLVGDVVGGSVPPNFDKSTHGSSAMSTRTPDLSFISSRALVTALRLKAFTLTHSVTPRPRTTASISICTLMSPSISCSMPGLG